MTTDGATIYFDRGFETYFPQDQFAHYSAFTFLPGDPIKREARTRITKTTLQSRTFVLKHYLYPAAAQLRTWYRQSKAHTEFSALYHFRHLEIPCITPVACGLERSRIGSVKSCFLITEYAEGFLSLRDWMRTHPAPTGHEIDVLQTVFTELGQAIRRAHAQGMFLSRLSAKNIMICGNISVKTDWCLLDQSFARFQALGFRASRCQSLDLGRLKGSLTRFGREHLFEAFLETYRPDPLGGSDQLLDARIAYGLRVRREQTAFLRVARYLNRKRKYLRNRLNPSIAKAEKPWKRKS